MKDKFRISSYELIDAAFPFECIFRGIEINFHSKDLCSFRVNGCSYSISSKSVLLCSDDVLQIKADNGFAFIQDSLNLRTVEEGLDLKDMNGLAQISSNDLRDEEEINIFFHSHAIYGTREYIRIKGISTFADIYARWRVSIDGNGCLYISCSQKKRETLFVSIKDAKAI